MPVPPFLQTPLTMYDIASQYWDLKAYPSQYIFSLLAAASHDRLEKGKCAELASSEGQEDWLNYCRRPKRTILEVLHDFHKSASKLTIEILFELFSSIKPRSFSIASSSLPSGGRSLDLLIAVVEYRTKLKMPRLGLCSNWLAGLRVGEKVYGWIKKGTFKFPNDYSTPLILIGPGTGLAPFRSVLQTLDYISSAQSNTLHLFVGCRYRERDYHCGEELERMAREGKITLYCAFSRDQENKIYVQHKIAENSKSIWELISNGAYIFISGNAKNMPDNVRDAFVDVIRQGGKGDDARRYLKDLEDSGRLQVETW